MLICREHARSIMALSSAERASLWYGWMDSAELNAGCDLWQDCVSLAACATDIAMIDAQLQASLLKTCTQATLGTATGCRQDFPCERLPEAVARYQCSSLMLCEAYLQIGLAERAHLASQICIEHTESLLIDWYFACGNLGQSLSTCFTQMLRASAAGHSGSDQGVRIIRTPERYDSLLDCLQPLTTQITRLYSPPRRLFVEAAYH
jgi:hypothetical protein